MPKLKTTKTSSKDYKKKSQRKPLKETKQSKKIIKELENQIKLNEEKYIRLLAEFDNYKKRKNIEIDNLLKYEGYDFFKSLLNTLDDIDRTLEIKDVKNNKSIYNGLGMIKDKIISLLDSKNIIPYNSVNEIFNPDLHEALMVKKTSKKTNTIIEEFEKGYNYKDKVLRHAKVVVSE
jgi:molecular chaperone GrpE